MTDQQSAVVVGTAEDKVHSHWPGAQVKRIGCRSHMADSAVGEVEHVYTDVVGIGAVAVPASDERRMPVDHPEFDRTSQRLGIVCSASQPTSL